MAGRSVGSGYSDNNINKAQDKVPRTSRMRQPLPGQPGRVARFVIMNWGGGGGVGGIHLLHYITECLSQSQGSLTPYPVFRTSQPVISNQLEFWQPLSNDSDST